MGQGQGPFQGSVGQVYTNAFECDYAELETRAAAAAGIPLDFLRGQAKCGKCRTVHSGGHSADYCATRVVVNDHLQRGYVPVSPVLVKMLKEAGVPVVLAPFSTNQNLKAPIKRGYPRLPKSGYAPFWVVSMWRCRDFGNRTSLRNPKVRRFVRMLREVDDDPRQQMEFVLEEMLLGGELAAAAKHYQRIYGGCSKAVVEATRQRQLRIMRGET